MDWHSRAVLAWRLSNTLGADFCVEALEEAYLHAYVNVAEAKTAIGAWLRFYNEERQHQSHGYRTPRQVYEAQSRWICGRSASPTGFASPASRAGSESGEMLAFAHIPTGTTVTNRIDIDDLKGRTNLITVAPVATGAETEIGWATP